MLAFRRTFYIKNPPHQDDNKDSPLDTRPVDLFQAVSESLRDAIAALTPDDTDHFLFQEWPNRLERDKSDEEERSLKLNASLWENDEGVAPRLFEITLERAPWRVELALGQRMDGGPVIIYEKAYWLGMGREIDLQEYPDLLSAFQFFRIENVEGYAVRGIIHLRQEKVRDFIRFLQAPERQLPVVFYAGPDVASEYGQPEAAEVHAKLQGLAYVVVAQDRQTVNKFNQALRSHPAYYGTIRLYHPCLQTTDSQWQHPYWPGKKAAPDTVLHQLFNYVARESLLLGPNAEIEALRRLRLRQKIEQSKQAQDNIQEWEEIAESLEKENAYLESQIEYLQDELKKLRAKLHIINPEWQNDAPSDENEANAAYRLFFSQTARERYASLEPGERRYWDEHILPKLVQPELLRSQSEPISGSKNGAVFVYPRGRSHDGRRVLYYLQEDGVYVCAIFTTNEHDRYGDLRAQGIDRADYHSFQEHLLDIPS